MIERAAGRFRAPWLLAIPIGIYVLGMAPSLAGGDPDEFLLQAYRRGVGHPGGSAVYIWIGSLFMLLTGNALYTLNLVSVVFGIATLLLLFALVRRMGVAEVPATIAVLMFAFVPVIWRFAMRGERYAVNACFLVAMVALYFLWSERHTRGRVLAAGFLTGLGFGVHFPNVLMVLPIIVFVAMESPRDERLRSLAWTVLAIGLGAVGPIAYVYFRSRTAPPIGTEYNPDTIPNLILYLMAEGRSTILPPWTMLAGRIGAHAALFAASFLGIGLLLALEGFRAEWRRRRSYAMFLLLLLAINFLFFSYYSSDARFNKPILAYVIVGVFLAIGVHELYARHPNARARLSVLFGCLIALQAVGFGAIQRLGFGDVVPSQLRIFKKDSTQLDEARLALSTVPANAILFASWNLFPTLLCIQEILGENAHIEVYEGAVRPRHYVDEGRIVTIDTARYIDDHIHDRPVFYLRPHRRVRAHLEKRYLVEEGPPGLLRLRAR